MRKRGAAQQLDLRLEFLTEMVRVQSRDSVQKNDDFLPRTRNCALGTFCLLVWEKALFSMIFR